MAAFNKINDFVNQIFLGRHKFLAAADVCKAMLTNVAPVATNTVKTNLTEIGASNGYTAGGADIQNDYSMSSSVLTAVGTSVTWTGTTSTFGPFQYVAVYNDTSHTGDTLDDPLVCWWNYGSSISVGAGETFALSFGASWFTLS